MIKGTICRRYSLEEDSIIVDKVRTYPTNLQKAFKEASNVLYNRPQTHISRHWYCRLRLKANVNVITCGSSKGFTKNVKNVKRDKLGNMPDQHLKGVEYIMKELLELNPSDRNRILKFFK